MEKVDAIIYEYIDFVNDQVGVYMDALAGFAGHKTRVERQVHRANKPKEVKNDKDGMKTVVWASYEDLTKPDIIHNRIMCAEDYIAANSSGGSNERQHSQAILVFLYTYWEAEIRPRLAVSLNIDSIDITSDIMGDIRILRNAILHSKGVLRADKYRGLVLLKKMYSIDEQVYTSYDDIHKIFALIKQDCGRMLCKYFGTSLPDGWKFEDIIDVAIQRRGLRDK